jgi:hypothetical protein
MIVPVPDETVSPAMAALPPWSFGCDRNGGRGAARHRRGCRLQQHPSPVGDPDPGHRLLDALRPVAAVVPSGTTVSRRTFTEPRWDSCDGIKSTYGWDDVTVGVGFVPIGLSDAATVNHIKDGLRSQGWTFDAKSSSDGAWYWDRQITADQNATIQLLAGEASTHPSGTCRRRRHPRRIQSRAADSTGTPAHAAVSERYSSSKDGSSQMST